MTSPSPESTGTFPDNQEMSKCLFAPKKLPFRTKRPNNAVFSLTKFTYSLGHIIDAESYVMNWGTLVGKLSMKFILGLCV